MRYPAYAGALIAGLFAAGAVSAAGLPGAGDTGSSIAPWHVADAKKEGEGTARVGPHEPTSTGPERTVPSAVEPTGTEQAPTATTDERARVPTTTGPERTDPSQVGRTGTEAAPTAKPGGPERTVPDQTK